MAVLEWFAGLRSPFWDAFFSFWSFLGEQYFMLAALCIIYWCLDKRLAYRIGLAVFFSGCAVQTAKIICRIPRPWVLMPGFQPVSGATATATGYSFPSGHTQTATAVFGVTATYFKRNLLYLVFGFAALMVGCSRMYLGVHTPADVFTAMGVSAAAAIILALLPERGPDRKKDLVTSALLAVFGLAALVTGLVIGTNGTAEYSMTADTVKMGAAALGFSLSYYIERNYIDFELRCRHRALNIPKVLLGVAGMLALKEGIKLISASPAADAIRYFLVICWGMLIYPLLINRLFADRGAGRARIEKHA